ncbi:hypothetical protein [Phenylobacterium sp.]|uniref:hypothetical protein n=1 Tax=Phenylobacterium sp. TaxID=1871053 RepID=UPI0025FF2B69|nr:hypothetical protein [Phenylobacterium sp.]MCA3740270.1 hypothetical protein [Phenylobacterium sp.]
MEGLEVSILPLSEVKKDNRDLRLDSRYFSRAALAADALVAARTPQPISQLASDVRSFGAYALTNEFEYQDEGVPFLRGTNYVGDFINFTDVLRISPEAHGLLHKSEVLPGMVLLSMSGSVGSVAVALDSWEYPINSNQDIAKIVPSGVDPFYLASYLSSSFGEAQIERLPVGSVQQHIFLWMIERIQVPRLGSTLEAAIAHRAKLAFDTNEDVSRHFAAASDALLSAVGLKDWRPPEPLSYSASASAVLSAQRMDARFFAPRVTALLDVLSKDGVSVRDVASPRREKFRPGQHATFSYIEIGDVDGAGAVGSSVLPSQEAPSRATWYVRTNDVVTSTVRPIRRLSAQIDANQNGYVCSSGFVVAQPMAVAPEVLLTYLRLPVICELLDLYASASMYPAITEDDIFDLPMPRLEPAIEARIVASVQAGKQARARATQLLKQAKRAVELAIEEDERAALAFLGSPREQV